MNNLMYERGCVVSITLNEEERSLSGILLDTKNGLILTHGSLVSSLLSDCQIQHLSTQGKLLHCFRTWQSEVILQNSNTNFSSNGLTSNFNNAEIRKTLHYNTELEKNTFSKFSATVVAIFIVKKLQQILSKVISLDEKWEFIDDTSYEGISDDQKRMQKLLPSFILLQIDDWEGYNSTLKILNYSQYNKGDRLDVVATPFASLNPDIFMNHKSSGIISNKSGGILIMTDARCVPGTDGGAVLCRKTYSRYLIGIVITSLFWKSNEWVGLSLVCAIPDVLKTVERICKIDKMYEDKIIAIHRNRLSETIDAVPMVIVGSNWGSGIVIGHKNNRYLLTCSHVLKGSDYNTVKVKYTGNRMEKGKVVYKTPAGGQFDIALLSISSSSIPYVPLGTVPVVEEDKVYVIGHALFGEEKDLEPTITSGIVSKVVRVNGIPVMIQTTCAVHAGASGGALVNQFGELVGIPVSNAKDMSSKALYPHINMSVPLATVAGFLHEFMESKDASVLKNMSVKNKHIRGLWVLEQTKGASKL